MKASKIAFGLLLAIAFISPAAFGGGTVPPKSAAPHQITIKEIVESPSVLGTTVEVSGTFLGWGGHIGSPPVTRSDCVIEDATGQIYFTGPLPKGVRMKDVGKPITLRAKVKSKITNYAGEQKKVIYLEVLPRR